MVPRLFIETDIFSDVDDVGAIALANVFHLRGEAQLIGIGVNTASRYGPEAASILNVIGGSNAPVGRFREVDDSTIDRDYACDLVTTFGAHSAPIVHESVALWRKVLSESADASVTVVSIGFLTNLADLLKSGADEHSELSGRTLVERKVARTVVMAAHFPQGREFNLYTDVEASAEVLANWPGTIEFVGYEVGKTVLTGHTLPDTLGSGHPVSRAYAKFWGAGNGRSSWDLIAVFVAVRGTEGLYQLSAPGRVVMEADGSNTWLFDPEGRHRYLEPLVSDDVVAERLENLLTEFAPAFGADGAVAT